MGNYAIKRRGKNETQVLLTEVAYLVKVPRMGSRVSGKVSIKR
jgi:hypothetical protein